MKLIWTIEAKATYNKNIEYLLIHWNTKEVMNFNNEVESVLKKICNHPKLGKYDEVWDSRKIVIVKQITLYYDIDVDKGNIVLLSFWNNYQKPKNQE